MIQKLSQQQDESISDSMAVRLDLTVTDREVVAELVKHDNSSEQSEFALSALKVGVLAIRQASGAVDAKSIHDECQRFVAEVGNTLTDHSKSMSGQVEKLLGKYFDPSNGEFQQRIDRLIRKDGELETILGKHLQGEKSSLASTLEEHVGTNSPLLQMLSPDQQKGILAAMKESMDLVLTKQGKSILGQFSLDDQDSALSRLVRDITQKNGSLRTDLAEDFENIRKEFSLDNDEGALSRLVGKVERAHKTILNEFSADNEHSALSRMSTLLGTTNKNINDSLSLDLETSPLSRLRREILLVIEGMNKTNNEFQEQVRLSLEAMKVRKAESARSTTHGLDFQDAVGLFIRQESQRLGDMFEATKDTVGKVSRCKVGDHVVTLGEESAAPGARIVYESKQDKSYTQKDALAELQKARENREAQVGVFVFSRRSAPDGMEPLTRMGKDLIAIWDAEDTQSDLALKMAISLARMITVRERMMNDALTANITEMQGSIDAMIREMAVLDEIMKLAKAAETNTSKIATKAEKLKKKVNDAITDLQKNMKHLETKGKKSS
ncbi:MAG: hypothetical protein ACKO9Z_08700 [Planctomycetota bacterium]